MKKITVAHSPDADDIFMLAPIKFGWCKYSNLFTLVSSDIESLNKQSLIGKYDITAISFGVYPLIKDDYALLRGGVSFGYGYGPKLIKKENTTLKRDFTVAISGSLTTNALIFKMAYPRAKIVYKNFLEIEDAVLKGEVDSGILIHESILTYNNSLTVEAKLWDIWLDICNADLPLPLGGLALRRSIPINKAILYENIMMKSIKIANMYKRIISNMLIERKYVRVDGINLDTYVDMYANTKSIEMDEKQIKALEKLYIVAYEKGFYNQTLDIKNYLIPKEYANKRHGLKK